MNNRLGGLILKRLQVPKWVPIYAQMRPLQVDNEEYCEELMDTIISLQLS